MANKTQCPKCGHIYHITDERYQESRGRMRCSHCGERFRSTFLAEVVDIFEDNDRLLKTEPNFTRTPPSFESNEETLFEPNSTTDNINQDDLFDLQQNALKFDLNPEQTETVEIISERNHNPDDNPELKLDLIDEVNEVSELIDEKLFTGAHPEDNAEAPQPNDLFTLDKSTSKATPIIKGTIILGLIILSAVFSITLTYQLWLKQHIDWPVFEKLAPYAEKLNKKLIKPVVDHNNVALIQLVSARTEPHPTRASTTLLKFSLLNHSKLDQDMPRVEFSLTDKDGRIVSRRALSPLDYLYKNNTSQTLRKNELKNVTIELLNFPQQVYGYQVRILK